MIKRNYNLKENFPGRLDFLVDEEAKADVSTPAGLSVVEKSRPKPAILFKKPAISIFGLGYVGAVSAACFSGLGHKVVGVDTDELKVDKMSVGKSVIVEKGLDELLARAYEKKLLAATRDAEQAILNTDVSFISVCTPSNDDGSCNLSFLKEATRQIGKALGNKPAYHLVVYRSTVPPKTTREVMIPLLEESSGKRCGKDFGVCYNPEFLRESTAIDDFHKPPKTVIGAIDRRSADYAALLYKDVQGGLIRTTLEAAELVKCVDNTWHALKVCFGNEVGRLCQAVDVDSHEVMDIFLQDRKLNLSSYYLKPGFAYGGSCLPKEIRSMQHLARSVGVDLPVINHIDTSNVRHIRHAENLIADLPGASVGFVGVSFKPGTDDLRESPTIALMHQLKARGRELLFYDPYLNPEQSASVASDLGQLQEGTVCSHFFTLIRKSDVVVIAHNHPYAEEVARIARMYTHVVDLVRLPGVTPKLANYSGVCW